jgi:hypothetical protein
MKDNTMAHTANNSMDASDDILRKCFISQELWPLQSPNLNPCNLSVGHAESRSVCEQSTLCGRTLKKILDLKFLLFPYNSFDMRPETYSHDVRHA